MSLLSDSDNSVGNASTNKPASVAAESKSNSEKTNPNSTVENVSFAPQLSYYEMEDMASDVMIQLKWFNHELRQAMMGKVKEQIMALNNIYWSEVNRLEAKRNRLGRESMIQDIIKKLVWDRIRTSEGDPSSYDGTGRGPNGPEEVTLSDGTQVKLRYVTFETREGELIRFENKSSYPDNCRRTFSDGPYARFPDESVGPCVWLPVQEDNDDRLEQDTRIS